MNICVVYSTAEGHTARIAERVAAVIRDHGHEARTVEVKRATPEDLRDCDGVVVGASVHMGAHDRAVVAFVRTQRAALERMPSAFFSVSLAAHGDAAEADRYVEEFQQTTGWRPRRVARFGGALLYTRYGFVKRRIMRKIALDKPGDLGTDTTRDYVYTEWDDVTRFADDVLRDVTAAAATSG